jgi:hypothetical protein
MKSLSNNLKPQDVVVLLKLASERNSNWRQIEIAETLGLSQSEVSQSVARAKYAGLIDPSGKEVLVSSFLEFLEYGLRYVFPQRPGEVVRGVPTAHSAPPMNAWIESSEHFVWPYNKGTARGLAVIPLYRSVPGAALRDDRLHSLLALVDVFRVGRARERELAKSELRKRLVNGE